MLKCFNKLHQLSFSQLMEVYLEGNLEKSGYDRGAPLLRAEQEFYDYLSQVFFRTPGAVYCVWEEKGTYAAAVRLEPYREGLLICALETAPSLRRRGYARSLLNAVRQEFSGRKLYSHVAKTNLPSVRLHEALGFRKIADRSVYMDGSVNDRCATYLWEACFVSPLVHER